MMSAKLATLGLLQITVIWNKVYDVIIYLYDVTNKILSRNSNYVIEVVMWPNFGNSSISMREVIETSIYKYLTRKTNFFEGCCWLKFNNGLEILHQCGKRVKTKSQKVLGANSYVCRSYRRKTGTVGGGASPPRILNRVKPTMLLITFRQHRTETRYILYAGVYFFA